MNKTIHRCQIIMYYLIFYKEVEHVDGQLPLRAVLDGKLQDFCLDFGLLGLGRLVRLLLCLTVLWGGLGREEWETASLKLNLHKGVLFTPGEPFSACSEMGLFCLVSWSLARQHKLIWDQAIHFCLSLYKLQCSTTIKVMIIDVKRLRT